MNVNETPLAVMHRARELQGYVQHLLFETNREIAKRKGNCPELKRKSQILERELKDLVREYNTFKDCKFVKNITNGTFDVNDFYKESKIIVDEKGQEGLVSDNNNLKVGNFQKTIALTPEEKHFLTKEQETSQSITTRSKHKGHPLHEITDDFISELFNKIDSKHSGTLDKKGINKLLTKLGENLNSFFGLRHKKLDEAFSEMDKLKTGRVTMYNFLEWQHRNHPTEPHHLILQSRSNAKERKTLSKKEVSDLLKRSGHPITGFFHFGTSKKKLNTAYEEMDKDKNGSVTMEEFLSWQQKKAHAEVHADKSMSKDEHKAKYHKRKYELLCQKYIPIQTTDSKKTVEIDAHIHELFSKLDKNNTGYLNEKEVGKLTKQMGEKLTTVFGHKKLDTAFYEMDVDGICLVTVNQFLDWHHRTYPTEFHHLLLRIQYLFEKVDVNNKGWLDETGIKSLLKLTGHNLTGMFHFGTSQKQLNEAFAEMDTDGSGLVVIDEFIIWHQNHIPDNMATDVQSLYRAHKLRQELQTEKEFVDTSSIEDKDAELNEMKEEYAKLKEKHALSLGKQKSTHKIALENIATQHKAEMKRCLDEAKGNKTNALEALAQNHRSEIQRLENQIQLHKEAEDTRMEAHKLNISKLELDHKEELQRLKEEYQRRHHIALEELKNEHKSEMKDSLNKANEKKRNALEKLLGKHKSEMRQSLIEANANKTNALEALAQKHRSEMQNLENSTGKKAKEMKNSTGSNVTKEMDAHIRELFSNLDINGTGSLNRKEIGKLTKQLGEKLTTMFGHKKLDVAFHEMDFDGSNSITVEEFLNWHHRKYPTEPRHFDLQAKYFFKKLHLNAASVLDKKDVKRLLKEMDYFKSSSFLHSSKTELNKAFAEIDTDESGMVTIEEFSYWLQTRADKLV